MAKISINNGRSFTTPEKAIEEVGFEEIVTWMDAELTEQVHSMDFEETDLGFLKKYLEVSKSDLIIG